MSRPARAGALGSFYLVVEQSENADGFEVDLVAAPEEDARAR